MRVRTAVLVIMAGWSLAGGAQQRFAPVEVEAGSRLFQANCTGCHGPEGDGVPGVNFSKGQYRRASSDDELLQIIVRGIPGTPMPPSSFSEGQATTVVAYLRTMAAAGSAAPGTSTGGDVRRGKAVFDGKGQCATCHSVNGVGARSGPALTEIGTFRRTIELEQSLVSPDTEIRAENRSVRIITRDGATITGRLFNQDTFTVQLLDPNERLVLYEKANLREVTVLKTSTMPSYRDRLTPQELGDLVAYLATLKGKS